MGKNKITIGIDGGDFVPGSQVASGIQRIVSSFLKEIEKFKSIKNNYYYFGRGGLPTRLFSSFYLPRQFIKDNSQIFLGFSGVIPALLRYHPCLKVVFLYDIGFLKYPRFYLNSKRLAENTAKAVKYSDKIIVLSNYARKELIRYFPAAAKKAIVIYPGANHLPGFKKNKNIYGQYLLYVGVIKPIKSIAKVLNYLESRTYRKHKLLLVGKKEEEYFAKIINSKEYQNVKERVVFIENATDRELTNYYINCEAVVNFSHEEGLCFPVLEAMKLGKRIIANSLPVYKELDPSVTWYDFTSKLVRIISKL